MQITIGNIFISNLLFFSIFLIFIILSIKKKESFDLLSISVTQELKGVAIFGVIFSHIGYFLSTNNSFLFPLSIIAGISVDLFLFLSGFGLTISTLKKDMFVKNFYKKNIPKLYTPFWLSLAIFFILSFFIAHINYSVPYIIKSFAGIFTTADIYKDINSPLWYFSLIIFYYLLFPLVFSKKKPWLSAIVIYLITFLITKLNLHVFNNVSGLQNVHTMAFPIGIIFGYLLSQDRIKEKINCAVSKTNTFSHISILILLSISFASVAYFSGVGHGVYIEQIISMLAVFLITSLFIIKKINIKLFYVFGLYSYEIYLLHWPIMYHYDFLYRYTPAWLATSLYLIILLGLGYVLKYYSDKIQKKILE